MTGGAADDRWALVVTGDSVLATRAAEGLRAAGFVCDTADTGLTALPWLEGARRDYALIVLDLDLAGVPATEVLTIASIVAPRAGVIVCGLSAQRAPLGRVVVRKPALASEFTRAAREFAAHPRTQEVTA